MGADCRRATSEHRVGFQKWRSTESDVTLGLTVTVSQSQQWPVTFIVVQCSHCHSEQIVKRNKTAWGTRRYLCQNALGVTENFLLDHRERGCLSKPHTTLPHPLCKTSPQSPQPSMVFAPS
jgi:hypothetical protein